MTEVDTNALLERVSTLEKENEGFKVKIADLEKQKTDFETSITNKDAEIGKLQKLLADNLIAGTDKKDNGTTVTSFADAYKQAIKDNKK